MATIGRLAVKIDADTSGLNRGLSQADGQVSGFENRIGGLSGTMSLASKAAGLFGAALGAAGVAGELIKVQRQFDVLNASLVTVTGSAANARGAFEWIQRFAATTPYQLEEVTSAFIKMKAMGLDASEESLRSYGNTASAMGKSLNQMIEAVADAATGEFERLKEFGIRAQKEGENVSLTFRGVTTTIGNSSREITEYLRRIGEEDFAGAMNERIKTLDGSVSNLADSYNKLLLTISQGGFGQAVSKEVSGLSSELNAISDAMEASAKRGEGAFMQLATGAGVVAGRSAFGALEMVFNGTNKALNFMTGGVMGLNENVRLMPDNLKPAAVQMELMTKKLQESKVKYDELAARLATMPESIYLKSELHQLGLYIAKLDEATKKQRLMQTAVASIAGLDFRAEDARLARSGTKPAPKAAPVVPKPATGGGGKKDTGSIFDDGDPVQNELSKRFEENRQTGEDRYAEELAAFVKMLEGKQDALRQSNISEAEIAQEKYTMEAEKLLEAKEVLGLTEEEYSARLLQIRMDRDESIMNSDIEMLDHEKKIAEERVKTNKEAEDQIIAQKKRQVEAVKNLLAQAANHSKAAFNIQKAVSISETVINTYKSATGAYAALSSIPYVGPALGAAAAAAAVASGMANVAAIKGQQFGGGGSVSASAAPSAPSIGGGGGGGGVGASAGQSITIQGISSSDLFSGDSVRTLIDSLIDAQRNGAKIVLA